MAESNNPYLHNRTLPLYIPFIALSLCVVFSVVTGITNLRRANTPDKIFILYITLAGSQEYLGQYLGFWTAHIFAPLELLILGCYFDLTFTMFKRNHIGTLLGSLGFVISLLNTWLLQPLSIMNTNFLMLEYSVIILFCLYAYLQILMIDLDGVFSNVSFWIVSLLLFYFSITFAGWGVFTLLPRTNTHLDIAVNYIRYFSSLLFYLAAGIIFLRYPKMIRSGE